MLLLKKKARLKSKIKATENSFQTQELQQLEAEETLTLAQCCENFMILWISYIPSKNTGNQRRGVIFVHIRRTRQFLADTQYEMSIIDDLTGLLSTSGDQVLSKQKAILPGVALHRTSSHR